MIYTVTFNPAIDYTVELSALRTGTVNRCSSEYITFGGKGLNVSALLTELGIENKALGFCAGFTGKAIEQELERAGISSDFIHLPDGNSRINVKIKADEETEINGNGPEVIQSELDRLFAKLGQVTSGDIVVLAGSIPPSVPQDIYEKILEIVSERSAEAVVDAQGELLANVLRFRPFLIKPNHHELEQLYGEKIHSEDQLVELAQGLRRAGARNVLVSLAQYGSLLVSEDDTVHRLEACTGEVVSSVGAGDSMVAGFLAGYLKSKDYVFSHMLAAACGAATTFSRGIAKRELIFELFRRYNDR